MRTDRLILAIASVDGASAACATQRMRARDGVATTPAFDALLA
jgi:hypothetical protein